MSDRLQLLDALRARSGIVCLIGAGGKKTAIYLLAAMNASRTGVSSTVRIPPFPVHLRARVVVRHPAELQDAVLAQPTGEDVAFAHPSERSKRLAGVDPDLLAEIHAGTGFVATYVKADGARFRWIKAPDRHEPQIVSGAKTVIPVVSVRAIGQPLGDRVAHHPNRLGEIVGLALGGVICPEHVGELLGSEYGSLQGIPPGANVVPLINMVDNYDRAELAREAARIALARSGRFDRVVLASLKSDTPLIEVITR